MGAHSGVFGVVDSSSTVKNWTITDTSSPQAYKASNTKQGTGRVKGVREWSGTYMGLGHTPPVLPGAAFSFAGYTAPDDDVSGNNGTVYSGTARVSQVVINWNFESGEPINWSTTFVGHLALAVASAAPYSDASAPTVFSPFDCVTPAFGDDVGALTPITDVTSISLTITNDVKEYVNSSTIIAGKAWKGRTAGSTDWTASINIQNTSRGIAVPAVQGDKKYRFYVGATQYWELFWGHLKEVSGISVDRDAGNIVAATLNLEKNGFVGGITGRIRVPGAGSSWWGT